MPTLEAPLFLKELESDIARHPAARHPFLERFSLEALNLHQIRTFGLQHYQLVKVFTTYMTNVTARLQSAAALLRGVFDDEFGQYTIFRSHVHLYRNFLKALGLEDRDWGRAEWLPETRRFIEEHLKLTRDGDILMALGAIGPGHEFSIPLMFEKLLLGFRRNTPLEPKDLEYFTMHIEEDKEHAVAFNKLIEDLVQSDEDRARIREGALFSLKLRRQFWDGCHRAVFGSAP